MLVPQQPFTIETLYKAILQIGSECISCGIYYKDFKQSLIDRRFIQNNLITNELDPEIEEYIKYYFETNFLHADTTCSDLTTIDKKCCKLTDQKHLESCKHFISQDSCMNLLALKQAELSERESSNNLKSVKTVNKIAYTGLIIAVIGLGYNITKDIFFNESPTKSLLKIQQSIDTINKPLFSVVSKYLNEHDSVHTNHSQNKLFVDSLKNIP